MSQRHHNYGSLTNLKDDQVFKKSTLLFDVEQVLLKSFSMFPYFMLVALEGGGVLRALILLLIYPLICLLREDVRLKIMVFVCFFGIEAKGFRLGRSCLPKFLLENVGEEGFEMVKKFDKKVGISRLPRVMVEGYLKDYLGIDDILGGEIIEFGGYYMGFLAKMCGKQDLLSSIVGNNMEDRVVGITGDNPFFDPSYFMYCKDLYLVSKDDKKNWRYLPKNKYPKPLIFHDSRLAFEPTPLATLSMFIWLPFGIILCITKGIYLVTKDDKKWRRLSKDKYPNPLIFHDSRLAFEPTPLATLSMFIWLPFGIILCITRMIIGILFPYKLSPSLLAFLGVSYMSSNHEHLLNNKRENSNGILYVCNHKTVIDAVCLSVVLQTHRITAVSYSISKLTALISPSKTVNLTRDKAKDSEIMLNALSKGDLVVCPEGTTCREPYLLRFSPLFAEMSDDIIPIGVEVKVSMLYGTTEAEIKALDPFFVILNPKLFYYLNFLENLPKNKTCKGGGLSRIEVANYVQAEIGKALGYKCTQFTRKDKYAILAGNDGLVRTFK